MRHGAPRLLPASVLEAFDLVPSVLPGNPAGTILRVMTWASEWARPDLAEPHWHLDRGAASGIAAHRYEMSMTCRR